MHKIIEFIKTYKWWIVIGLIIIAVAINGYRKKQADAPKEITQNPQTQNLTKTLELTGHIDALEKADLKFVAPSRLSWVGVKEGDMVKKWQGIASVDIRTLQKQLEQDLNNFNKAFRTHDQVLDDNNYYGNPDINQELKRVLENANYDLNNSVASVEIRNLAIKLSSIYSPFDGIVTRVDQPNAGVNVSALDVFQVINPTSLYFAAEVDELDISRITVGQKAKIVLDSYEDETIDSTITRISFTPVSGAASGTSYKVEFSVPTDNANFKYRIGMSGDASVILDQKDNILTIPSSALIEREEKYFVDIKTQSKEPERREVEIGLETDDFVEVISGITADDEIIIPQ